MSGIFIFVGLTIVGIHSSATQAPRADLVLLGGKVWTGTGVEAVAIAVRNGRVVAVGDDAAVEELAGAGAQRIRLGGRRVIPGLMDNHTHFLDGGFSLASVQLRDAATPEEFTRRIAAHAEAHPGEWMLGWTWDHELWGGELPRREWIDSVTGSTPVLVGRLDGHMSLANTRALELAGITAASPDPDGGTIVRDPDGQPTGIVKDAAQDLVLRVIPEPGEEEYDRALAAATRHAVAQGITHITDMGTWAGLDTYRRAAAAGRLPLRIYAAVPLATWPRLAEFVARYGPGDDRLRWGAVKGFVDGSLGSTTAWFYEPYLDEPGTSGLMVTDTATLREQILAADAAGLHVIVHAIGDRANDWLLDVFAEARRANRRPDQRFRVEHAQHLSPDAVRRFALENVIPSMQPYHAIDDGRWAERRIGAERCKQTYAFRDLLEAGARVTFGSDWTVAPLNPFLGIYAAVTRRTIDGAHPDGWVPEQRISIEEALTAYTASNAYAGYLDDRVGTIEVGKYADLVVLRDDLLALDPGQLDSVVVDITIVEGRIVYQR